MIECIICGNPTSPESYYSRNNNLLKLNKCNSCGHLFQDIKNYKDIYSDGKFTEIARNNFTVPSSEKIKSLDDTAFKRFNFYKPHIKRESNDLEVGSSIGSFVHLLKLYGHSATGIEPDPSYCDYSKKQYGFSQVNCSLEKHKADKKYDQIFSFHVIEHVKDPKVFIEKACSLLTEGGSLILECPSQEIAEYGDKKQMIWEPHIHYFSSSSIGRLLSCFFQNVKISYRGGGLSVIAKNPLETKGSDANLFLGKVRKNLISAIVTIVPFKRNNKICGLRNLILQFFIEKELFSFRLWKAVQFGLYKVNEFQYLKREQGRGKTKITHITNYKGWGNNAGDVVLSNCVRNTVSSKVEASYNIKSVADAVDEQLICEINNSKALLIGGGGLFLPDTNKNSISGWQWAVSKSQLDQIKSKVLLYAIGYNYFPGQVPNKLFIENLNQVIEKADFVGIRNRGSIEAVKGLLTNKSLGDKIFYQPCPTTIIRKNYRNIREKTKSRNIAVNIAFDRYERRFGEKIYEKLHEIAKALKKIENSSYKIFNVCHLTIDEKAEIVFDRVGLNYKTVRLQHMLPSEIFSFYNEMEVVLGMRGHAQMIPFGLNSKIITLGTHQKMKWFLDDINMNELFIDLMGSEDVCDEIVEKFEFVKNNDDQIFSHLLTEQEKLYNVTVKNLERIKDIIES